MVQILLSGYEMYIVYTVASPGPVAWYLYLAVGVVALLAVFTCVARITLTLQNTANTAATRWVVIIIIIAVIIIIIIVIMVIITMVRVVEVGEFQCQLCNSKVATPRW